jgi:hypothetical protein
MTTKATSTTEPVGSPVDRVVRPYPLDLVCLHSDECRTLMSKGHHDEAAFRAACVEWNGGELEGWGRVRHGWHRTIPDASGEYRTLMHPAKPGARGAYPTTCMVDNATCDDWA